MLSRRLFSPLVITTLALVMVVTGCAPAATPTATLAPTPAPEVVGEKFNTYPGVTLNVSRWAGNPWEGVMRDLAKEWGEKTSATVNIDAIPYENLHEKQVLEMSSKTGTYDIVYVHPSWFGEYVEAGYLLPIDNFMKDTSLNPPGFSTDQYVPSIFTLGNYKGQQYAFQDFIATVLLAYRKDVFEANGIPEPASWEDVLAAAEKLNGKDGMAGIVMPGKRTGAVADVFSSLIIGAGTWYFDENNKPALDVAKATEAVDFYAKAAKFAPEGVLNFHWDEAVTAAAQGKAAMLITLSTTLAWLDDPSRSSTVGKWAYVPLKYQGKPAGEVIYWNWAIAADSKNPKAAYEFLRWFTAGPQQARVAVQAFTGGGTKDFYADAELAKKLPFLGAVQEALTTSQPQPSLAEWPQIQDPLELAIQDAISGKKTAEEAAQSIRDTLNKVLGS
jgi:multiple sugar transport system substrate-binding protein